MEGRGVGQNHLAWPARPIVLENQVQASGVRERKPWFSESLQGRGQVSACAEGSVGEPAAQAALGMESSDCSVAVSPGTLAFSTGLSVKSGAGVLPGKHSWND